MATWDELREHLRTKYKLLHDSAEWVGLAYGFPDGERTVTQRVRVEPRAIGPIPGVMIWCDVIELSRVPATQALVRNMAFPIGALAAYEGLYVLVATLPLSSIVWSELDTILENLAHDAARLREDAPKPS